MDDILTALDEVLAARKQASAEDSYVASLNAAGLNKILEKVGEETTEVILAAKDSVETGNTDALTHEVADLWFHLMVPLDSTAKRPRTVLARMHALPCTHTLPGHL